MTCTRSCVPQQVSCRCGRLEGIAQRHACSSELLLSGVISGCISGSGSGINLTLAVTLTLTLAVTLTLNLIPSATHSAGLACMARHSSSRGWAPVGSSRSTPSPPGASTWVTAFHFGYDVSA